MGFDHHDPAFVADPYPFYERARREGPVVRSEAYGGFWLLTRHGDVRAALIDWHTFSSARPNATAIPSTHDRTEPDLPIELDPPAHTAYRALVSPVFRRRRIEDLRPVLRRHATALCEEMCAKGSVDLVTDFAQPMSVASLAAFMDLPDEDRDRWVAWVTAMFDVTGDRDVVARATGEYYAYIDDLVAERAASPREDFITMLLDSEIDGVPLSHDDVRSFCRILLIAGHETTASAMAQTLALVGSRPGLLDELRGLEPESFDVAVEEFLRLAAPVQLLARDATRDVEMAGCPIPAGAAVAMGYGSANRDPEVFEQPDECRLDRSPNPHLTFGAGPHLCLGAHLARLELTVMLEVLVASVGSLTVDPGEISWKPRGDNRSPASVPATVSVR
ncbi:MAG: cytochrome P450 [Acidimicrobiales bacterium]